MNRLIALLGLLATTFQALGAASWQNISVSTNPVTYTIITNLLGFTGSTTTFLRSDGTQATPAGTGGGNMTNSGAAVVGMLPVATDTSGTQWTPTNSISLDDVIAGTLSLSNMVANIVPVFDSSTNLVPSAASTNDLNAIAGKATVMGHYMGTDTNSLLAALGGAPLASPVLTGAPTINGTGIEQPISALTTSWSAASAGSNYVADLALKGLLFNMTTNLNLIHTTNGTANFTLNTITNYMAIRVINNSGTNFTVSWPATWHTVGTVASGFTLTNGDFCSIAIDFAGPSTDQTNNWIGVAYKQY